jgi:hypothetical protein
VPITASCPSLVRPSYASCWPTTHGGEKVRRPSVFKFTQQNNNREANILFFQCMVFLAIDVPSPKYGQIYNVLLDNKQYNVTIGNFPKCSCLYFVAMLASSLGGLETHVYHIL